jgi:hypothetical protein
MKGAPSADQDEDEDNGRSPASYEDDGGNTAQNARNAIASDVIGVPHGSL